MDRLEDVATIETPEHVELELRLANVGSRASAFLIDFLLQFVLILGMGIAVVLAFDIQLGWSSQERAAGTMPLIGGAILSVATFVVNLFYFTIFELLWRGQSPGKRRLKLRVLRDTGHPIDARTSLVRNLARIVDMMPLLYTVGMLAVFIDEKHRRIGDRAAGTIVVYEDAPQPDLSIARRWPAWMTPAEQELVGDWLDRRALLPAAQVTQVATALAATLVRTHGLPPVEDPERFLLELAA